MSPIYLLSCAFIVIASLMLGCEVRVRNVPHTVEYRSSLACEPSPQECPWADLERQAKFTALVNCLLSGATFFRIDDSQTTNGSEPSLVTPIEPRYGYERATDHGAGQACPVQKTVCQVASRHERELTWATCGTEPVKDAALRGGNTLTHADRLTESIVVTGRLSEGPDEFHSPLGLDGPDHFYTFALAQRTRMEIAVAANTSHWSDAVGLTRAAWQPALYLLSADGAMLKEGHVFRAGVTSLFPAEFEPGTYYLVVDSSIREWSRGDGYYRLYVGFHEEVMGPLVP